VPPLYLRWLANANPGRQLGAQDFFRSSGYPDLAERPRGPSYDAEPLLES
jgi:hypothetical protein